MKIINSYDLSYWLKYVPIFLCFPTVTFQEWFPEANTERAQKDCITHTVPNSRVCSWLPHGRVGGVGLVAQLCPTLVAPWTVAHQAPVSMGFSRQEDWSGLPFPSPGDLPNPGMEPGPPEFEADSLPTEPQGKPYHIVKGCSLMYHLLVCGLHWIFISWSSRVVSIPKFF